MGESSHQTVRLGFGRHQRPGSDVCVMELASMLAGERFTDHPRSVCPTVGALLRAYNDALGERERQGLFNYAAEAVGTRQGYDLQEHRARFALAWAQSRQCGRRRFGFLRRRPRIPRDASPVDVAEFVVASLGRHPTPTSRAAMRGLLDWIIAMRSPRSPTEIVPPDRPSADLRPASRDHEPPLKTPA